MIHSGNILIKVVIFTYRRRAIYLIHPFMCIVYSMEFILMVMHHVRLEPKIHVCKIDVMNVNPLMCDT